MLQVELIKEWLAALPNNAGVCVAGDGMLVTEDRQNCLEVGRGHGDVDDNTAEAYRKAAKQRYERDGEIEIDDNATISKGDDPGAYVQAWVWVYDTQAGLAEEE